MEPWVSWALALAVIAGAYFYYTSTNTRSNKPERRDHTPSVQRRQEKKQQTFDGANARLESAQPKKRKQAREQSTASATTSSGGPAAKTIPTGDFDEAETDDKEWAKQLQAAKQGVAMKPSTKTGAAPMPSDPRGSEIRSARPAENGSSTKEIPASQDVSDMLEDVAAAPSVLRLTGEEKAKKQSPKKPETAAESKKQRQNRKKVEERKALREEEEKERKVLEERQRRTAREARGEPAKNGMSVAPSPATGAWTNNSQKSAATGSQSQPVGGALLDTFDQDGTSAVYRDEPPRTQNTASTSNQTFPSEEAQMDAIREMNGDAGWNEVKTKKAKKKTSAPGSPPAEPGTREPSTTAAMSTSDLINGAAKAPGLPTKTAKAGNDYEPLHPATNIKPAMKAHPDDSDWAVE